jgi:hypothetical protein
LFVEKEMNRSGRLHLVAAKCDRNLHFLIGLQRHPRKGTPQTAG